MRSHCKKQVGGAVSWPFWPSGQSAPSEAQACWPHPACSARALLGAPCETLSGKAEGSRLERVECARQPGLSIG